MTDFRYPHINQNVKKLTKTKEHVVNQGKMKISWSDRDQFEDETTTENEDDLQVGPLDFENLVIAPSDWTVGTIYDLIGKQLHLDPEFQRRSVWQPNAKSQFIESLILGIPIPQILLASKAGQKNSFLVLDGKQRLSAIKEFIDGKFSNGSVFKLKGLRILTELEGLSWVDIQHIGDWSDRLLNESLRTTVLRGWSNEAALYEIFYRLNSGSVKLSPMELRMSLLPGAFLKFVIAWTETIGPVHHLLRKRTPDARMSDVELAIRYLAFKDQKTQYNGNFKSFLDNFCATKNNEFANSPLMEFNTNNLLDEMNLAIDKGLSEFGDDHFCRKFSDGDYENRFNRAVFDVLVGALSDDHVRTWVSNNPGVMKKLYEKMYRDYPEFSKSVESTTKSPKATRDRFSIWYDLINNASGANLRVPDIK